MIEKILNITLFSNTVKQYAFFILAYIISMVVINIIRKIVVSKLKKWAEKTQNHFDDIIVNSIRNKLIPVIYFGSLYISIWFLNIKPAIILWYKRVGIFILTFYGVGFILKILVFTIENYWQKHEKTAEGKKSIRGIIIVLKFVVWSLAITLLLDNLGIEISAIVAGLGIGGVAIALAAQAILGDLFSYFSIFFDRPFEIGDFIIIDDYLGVVDYVGIKTTRIKSLSGEELIFSNTDLTNSRIRNYKRMKKRRVVFKLGVTYQTNYDNLERIPGLIKDIIENIEDTVFDRAHFFAYGDFSLIFEIVYYIIGNDYNKYMDIQQDINLNIHKQFKKYNIEFAYPTQTLFIEK